MIFTSSYYRIQRASIVSGPNLEDQVLKAVQSVSVMLMAL